MEDYDKKISISHGELKSMAEQLTSAAGRLLAMCETEKAKGQSKEDKKGPVASVGKAALMLKLKDKV